MPTPVDMNSPIAYYGMTGLVISETPKALEHAINLAPNRSFLQGTVLGELSATLGTFDYYAGSTVATPAAITPTLTTSTTGGTLPAATAYFIVFSYKNGVGETVKSTEATITTGAGSTNSITVTTPAILPAGAVGINVYMGTVSGTNYFVGSSPTPVFVVTAVASGTVAPQGSTTAVAASNGTQTAKCVLRYPATTDAFGNITIVGPGAAGFTGIPVVAIQAGNSFGPTSFAQASTDALFGGFECDVADLIGLDTAALTAGFGSLENGVIGGHGRFRKA